MSLFQKNKLKKMEEEFLTRLINSDDDFDDDNTDWNDTEEENDEEDDDLNDDIETEDE